ncbi:helix-turn-helix transcriptional regulator [Blautia stercoris]|uniref:helix-turn-helix transcriptional regulator n=1 Tax=Blautia stercoris TaxID=871664 RepID=UPI00355BE28A
MPALILKSETGDTPINYLIQLRLEKAKEILDTHPEQSIQQISASVGYDDAYHFSKLFKNIMEFHLCTMNYQLPCGA